jgi:hypothetical protein
MKPQPHNLFKPFVLYLERKLTEEIQKVAENLYWRIPLAPKLPASKSTKQQIKNPEKRVKVPDTE